MKLKKSKPLFSNTSSSSSFSFMDRDDAMIILELERCLSDSPKFNLQRFREILEAKDHYGNGQVSRQQERAKFNLKVEIQF